MIGVVDSGMGGENTVTEIRRLYPGINILLLKDVKNAPYGTKSECELVRITEKNIERLTALGAETVLLACCTASTVWERLAPRYRERSIPILPSVADGVRALSECGRVALIGTDRTVSSCAFERLLPEMKIFKIAAQRLVSFVEGGERDGHVSRECREYLEALLAPLSEIGADTLILGCTHFPSLYATVSDIVKKYGIKYTVSSSLAGARALRRQRALSSSEGGVTVRL